jgi:AcrR family transcriptional regulator
MNRRIGRRAANRRKAGIPPGISRADLHGNRERILAVALRLFTSQGFHGTPTAQISREAGVSTGTLFHYFPDKNTLIDQLYLLTQREVAEAVRARDDAALTTGQRLERCFRGYIAWGVANPEKVRFFDQFYNAPSVGDQVKDEAHNEFRWLYELTGAAIREGVLRDLPLEFYFAVIPRILSGILELIESGKSGLTSEEIIQNGLDLILKG